MTWQSWTPFPPIPTQLAPLGSQRVAPLLSILPGPFLLGLVPLLLVTQHVDSKASDGPCPVLIWGLPVPPLEPRLSPVYR